MYVSKEQWMLIDSVLEYRYLSATLERLTPFYCHPLFLTTLRNTHFIGL
jgi:hypothetical protein